MLAWLSVWNEIVHMVWLMPRPSHNSIISSISCLSITQNGFTFLVPDYLGCPGKHTHIRLTALCPGLPGWAGTRKVKAIWILLKQETVSGSAIGWAVCKSAPSSRQITTPAPHHSVFYRPDALPAALPTVSKPFWVVPEKRLLNRCCL